jgi:plasmid stabilization system protein ParE
MAKPVFLTPTAKADLENISNWLFEKWSLGVLANFLALYEAKVLIISEYPSRYPIIHQASKLRKAVLTKHNIILYREMDDHIEMISIFDTCQDPDKIGALFEESW